MELTNVNEFWLVEVSVSKLLVKLYSLCNSLQYVLQLRFDG